MAGKIRGITVEIGGDTTKLAKALDGVNKQSKAMQTELTKVEKLLKLDPKNTELLAQKQELLTKAIGSTTDKLNIMRQAQEKVNLAHGANAEWEKQYAPLKTAIDDTKTKLKQLTAQQEDMDRAFAAGKISTEEYQKFQTELQETTQKSKDLAKQQRDLEAQFADGHISDEQYRDFQRELISTEEKLKSLQYQSDLSSSKLREVAKSLTGAGKAIGNIGQKTEDLGKSLTTKVTMPIVAIGAAATNAGMTFEAQMSRVQAIAEASGDDLKKLSNQAIQLGTDTSYSATEAAQGMENLASAGFTTNEIMSAMPGMLDLAASSGEDLANSADIAASTLRGFGLAADQAGHVADVLAKNAANTNAAIADTGAAMKYIAPVAQGAGWSLESVTAAIGKMADAGIKGEQAGTTLRGALTNLMNPSKQQAQAMKDIGFSAYDANGKMKPLSQIIGELDKKTKGLTDKQKDQKIATIMGTESLSGMQVLLKDGSKNLDTMTSALKNSDGAAKDMAKTMLNNAKGSVEQMKGSLETAGITISKSVAPTITKLADKVTDLANDFSKLAPQQQETIIKTAALVAAVGPATTAIGTFEKWVGSVLSTTGKTITAVKDFSSGLRGIVPAAGEGISGAAKMGSALAALGGPEILIPVAAAATAVGLITAAVIASKDPTDDLIKSINEERTAWEDTKKAADEKAGADLALIGRNQDLWKELKNVTDANGKVKKGYEDRANFIVGELNKALGTEYKLNGNTIESYKDMAKQIDNLIQKKRSEILLDAHKAEYQEALQKYAKKEQEQIQYKTELLAQQQKVAETKAAFDDAVLNGDHLKLEQTKRDYDNEMDILAKKQTAYNNNEGILRDYYKTINTYEGASTAATKGNYSQVEKALSSVTISYTVATGATKKQLEQQAYNANVALQNMRDRLNAHAAGVTQDMVDKAASAAKTANNEFLKVGNEAGKGITMGLDSQGYLIYTSGAKAGYKIVDGVKSVDYKKYSVEAAKGIKTGLDSQGHTIYLSGQRAGYRVVDGLKSVDFAKYGRDGGKSFSDNFDKMVRKSTPPQLWGKVNQAASNNPANLNGLKYETYWHAKGAVFDKPTIFGMYGGALQGAGEAGREAALPLNDTTYGEIAEGISVKLDSILRNSESNNRTRKSETISRAAPVYNQVLNVYSPEALTPSEVARQTRDATRQMILKQR